jgi:transposase-like protein
MSRKPRRTFTDEFKRDAVVLVHASEKTKSLAEVARDLGIGENPLREWVKKAEGVQQGRTGLTVSDERSELVRLREEVRILRMERDFLKKAAAFFAKENQ